MNYLTFIITPGISGAFWRACFVAALALILFALTRYWKSLADYSTATRRVLTGLRGVSLLLVACAFTGVWFEYESQSPKRILIFPSFRSSDDVDKGNEEAEKVRRVMSGLADNDLEFIDPAATALFAQDHPVASMIVTDGMMTARNANSEIERAYTESGGAPVFVVSGLEADQDPGVSIEKMAVEDRPLRGVPFTVHCMVNARGMRGRETLVTVSDDAQVRASGKILWSGDDERRGLVLEVVPKVAGWINYSVRVEAASVDDKRKLERPFAVFVEERRQRILILEGEPTWESKFVRRALDASELFDVDYFAQVSRATIAGVDAGQSANSTSATTSADRGSPDMRMRAALSSAAKLNSYDCIMLGPTPDALLSNAEATRLREWVERRGGGLIILGGNSFAGSIFAPKGKLVLLMPAGVDSSSLSSPSEAPRNTPIESEKSKAGVALLPTDEGLAGGLRAYSNALDSTDNKGALSGEGFRLGTLRPGATVLAVKAQTGEKGTRDLGEPLIVAMRYGAGRTFVVAPADSWRMRTRESGEQTENESPFTLLWQGLALAAASTSHNAVQIDIGEVSPAASGETTAEIQVRDEAFIPLKIEKLNAQLYKLDESDESSTGLSSQQIAFSPDPSDPSIWRARFIAPQPGKFDLRINYTANGKSGTADKYFATVNAPPFADGASLDVLTRRSRETGGDVFSGSTLTALKERLASLPQTTQRVRQTFELRSFWPLALIIPLLLSTEWLLQRTKRQAGGGYATEI